MTAWADIPGFEGRYQVSDDGQVRSLWFRNGTTEKARTTPYLLKPFFDPQGYRVVSLGRARKYKVSTLVLMAFVGERPPRPSPHSRYEAAHGNGVKTDDRLANLRWATGSENCADQRRHGTSASGERHPNAKFTAAQVQEIRQLRAKGTPRPAVARQFGVCPGTISQITCGHAWKDAQ